MFTLPNFCRVCLKYDKNLIDLAHIENEPSETLLSKLQLCVTEVEWEANKPLLCHPCIKRLNIAYSFKKQAVQSAGVLKNYVELVKESQKKAESQLKPENPPSMVQPGGGAYMLLPNQKYVKILVGGQNQGTPNTFQNVFLNLIPTSGANTTNNPPPLTITSTTQKQNNNKQDSNQNVFLNALNLSQAIQKLLPSSVSIGQVPKKKASKAEVKVDEDVGEMLQDDNAEEMSVEIDPTSFLQVEHDAGSSDEDQETEPKDWDNIITQQKVDPNKVNGERINGKDSPYVTIMPKQAQDFFSGQHFLSNSYEALAGHQEFTCNTCAKSFPTQKLLKQHMKNFHMGTKIDYEACQRLGLNMSADSALTLKDFVNADDSLTDTLNLSMMDLPADLNLLPNEKGQYVCTVCNRIFTNSAGLLRHKVRKHQQKNRKKYFIKGMKNARCDICNREFSTQSYMQMHRKLHLRDDTGGYKFKVLGKSKYDGVEGLEDNDEDRPKQKRGRKPKSWHQQNSEQPVNTAPKVKGKRGRKKRVVPTEFHEDEPSEQNKKAKLQEQTEQNNQGENSNSSTESESSSNDSNNDKPENGKEQSAGATAKEEENDSSSDSESDSSSSSGGEEDEEGEEDDSTQPK